MSKIKINVGQHVNLYRTYQYQIEENKIIEDFGSVETFEKFVGGELEDEEIEKLENEYTEDAIQYLRACHDYEQYDEDDDDVVDEVVEIADEPWSSERGKFFRGRIDE